MIDTKLEERRSPIATVTRTWVYLNKKDRSYFSYQYSSGFLDSIPSFFNRFQELKSAKTMAFLEYDDLELIILLLMTFSLEIYSDYLRL